MPKYVKKQEIKLSDEDLKKLETSIVYAIQESNKRMQEEDSPSREWMKFIMTVILWTMSGLLIVFGIAFAYKGIGDINSAFELAQNSIFHIQPVAIAVVEMGLAFFAFGLTAFSIMAAKELENEKDKNYIASMFSNIVALVALIIAFVALIKG